MLAKVEQNPNQEIPAWVTQLTSIAMVLLDYLASHSGIRGSGMIFFHGIVVISALCTLPGLQRLHRETTSRWLGLADAGPYNVYRYVQFAWVCVAIYYGYQIAKFIGWV
jgi:hypothetical protein